MKIALIYNKNQRVAIGERCKKILAKFKSLEIFEFNFREIKNLKEKFDLYFRLDDGDYTAIPKNLRPSVWWISDTHLKKPYTKIKQQVGNYDYVFCCQKEGGIRLAKETGRPTYWLPWACDEVPLDFEFPKEEDKIWDICFIGTAGKYSLRKVILELIKINYPNSFIGRTPYYELLNYYKNARIVINYSINNDINARIFEAMSAGALVITNRIKNNGFEEILKPDKHLVIFKDIFKDLKPKVDYYLRNITERQRIAQEGFEYVKRAHTYENRLLKVFQTLGIDLKK